ncbi:g3500 [Coccomyxa viridis]|uniref:G3500 protein n=1 Tax=Coccomyxa viridis TaxID=1274662 RepID=A0ABP1FMY2_9CHLO
MITCSLPPHPSIEANCAAFKFISRRCGAAMFALLDFDWELTPRQWGTMVQTCMFRDDEKAPERLEQTDMEAVYELLTDVAVDALAPDGLTAFLARGTAPDGRGTSAEPVRVTLPKLQSQQLLPFIWLELSEKAMGSLMLSSRARRRGRQQ